MKTMMRTLLAIALALPCVSHAAFEGADVPTSVKALYCDNFPRILVQFEDASKNIWYPASDGDKSKAFLALAIAAKTSSSKLYYFGSGNAGDLTMYCVNISARPVLFFGIQ